MADSPDAVLASLSASPRWFPHRLDPASGNALLVALEETDYRSASFLDQRVLRPDLPRVIVPWAQIAAASATSADPPAHFIFHIGHVGSTLVSRLLGEVQGLFALREPLMLRTLAELPNGQRAACVPAARALLSRRFRRADRALVKATSFTSEIGDALVTGDARALFMYATPLHYIQGIMAGDASRQELQVLHPLRSARLQTRVPELTDEGAHTEARRAALAWACEMTSLTRSAAALPVGRTAWLDFDRFLQAPAAGLRQLAIFFGADLSASGAQSLVAGPLMRRYSKALEYDYSPALRRDLLAEAGREHHAAIADALAWLAAAARTSPALTDALARAS